MSHYVTHEDLRRALEAMREQEDLGASYRWGLNAALNTLDATLPQPPEPRQCQGPDPREQQSALPALLLERVPQGIAFQSSLTTFSVCDVSDGLVRKFFEKVMGSKTRWNFTQPPAR